MKAVTILLLALPSTIIAQSKYDYNWIFGYDFSLEEGIQVNRMSFSDTSLDISEFQYGIEFNSYHGAISDKYGNLLFTTNGCQIVDSEGVLIENGDSINVDSDVWDGNCNIPGAAYNGLQSVLILPSLTNHSEYTILYKTLNDINKGTDSAALITTDLLSATIQKQEHELSVTSKNIPVLSDTKIAFGNLTAVEKQDGLSWWVLSKKLDSNRFWILSYDSLGIALVDSVELGPIVVQQDNGTGTFSPDGSQYMLYEHWKGFHTFDFDRATGQLSNHQSYTLEVPDFYSNFPFQATSCVYSPSGQFAYIIYQAHIYQLDLWAADIEASAVLVGEWNGSTSGGGRNNFYHGILGPDCNIYICSADATQVIHTIHEPDKKGLACDFRQDDIKLPWWNARWSFPNYPNFRIDEDQLCDPTITSVFGLPVEVVYKPRLSPNPTADITISNYPLQQYQIYDVAGQLHRQYSDSRATEEIDLTGLPSGLYIVKMQKENGTWWTEKVVRL